MADLTQTPANVGLTDKSANTAIVTLGLAAETISPGMPIYKAAADQSWYKADADASIDAARASHIAMTPAAAGVYVSGVTTGAKINVGATLVVGKEYVVSDTAGGIKPIDDLTTGDHSTKLGTAETTSQLNVNIEATGVVVP